MTVRVILFAVLITVAVSPATGQTNDNPFGFGTTLSGFAGGAADSQGTAPSAGLAIGWEFNRSFAVEGSALWSTPGNGQHEFSALIGPRFNLARARRAVPFLAAGAGMHRASFDNTSMAPPFYANRVTGAQANRRTFDDFAASVGSGVELFVRPHWAVRPDARVMMVTDSGNVRWITVFGVHAAYHFERHDIE